MDYNRSLKPITKPPKVRKFGSLDTETVTDKAIYSEGGVYVDGMFYHFENPQDLIDFISLPKYKSYTFFAHNATYDVGVLFKYLPDKHIMLFLGGKIFLTKLYPVKSRVHYIADSWRLAANISLHNLGGSVGLDKLPTPAHLLDVPLPFKRWACLEHHIEECETCYLKRDTEIVYNYIDLFQKEINALGGEMKNTLASTAMDLFRRRFLKREYKTPFKERNEWCRVAYFGGRVEPIKRGMVEGVNIYDINSLYPYVMREFAYPDPNTLIGIREGLSESVIYDYEGVSEVSIEVPPMHLPPLPFRFNEKLFFPIGKLKGRWTHVELRAAVERGCVIHKVHWTLYTTETCTPFIDYVETLYSLRLRYKAKKDPREFIVKIMLNSLYGKFAQRPDAGLQKLESISKFFNADDKAGYDFVVYDNEVYARSGTEQRKQPSYINVLWACYVTAYARLTLYEYMLNAGDNLAYVDTDSVFIQGTLETSTDLGGMKLEYANVDVNIIAPKLYQISQNGEVIRSKVRGVPSNYQETFMSEGQVSFMKALGFFEAAKRKLTPSQWIEVSKSMQIITPKRHYYSGERTSSQAQISRPHPVVDLLEM